jgi:D-alanyl-D-alanine-carboxypeptidase/D-alanyl-D-alanine-endopeptidase
MSPFTRISAPLRAITICGLLALPSPPTAAAQQYFAADEDVKTMLRYLVEDGETPGIVLGLLEADGSTRIFWYGSAGRDAKRPLGPKSIFEMGSITKVFTGILLADMVERGEVSLTDPVSKYLPAGVKMPTRNGKEITLLDLATHRSSLPRMPSNLRETAGNPYPEYSVQDMYAFLSQHELRRAIGSSYEYSNIGVALLGEVLGRVAGERYDVVLTKRVLEPLGMRMSSTVVTSEMQEWNTQGHNDGEVAPYRGFRELPGMGALRSNAEDMLKFLKANIGEPDSRIERVIRMTHEPRASVNEQSDIGLNWQIRKVGNRRILVHGGATAGYQTYIAFDPDKRVGIVQLTNTNDFGDDIGIDFVRRGPPLAIPEVSVAPNVMARYIGEYAMAPERNIVVRLEKEGYLTMQAPNNVRFRMYASSDTSFFVKRTPWKFTFTRDATGATTGMVADLEGQVRPLKKVSNGGAPPPVVAGNAALDLPLTVPEMEKYVGTYSMSAEGRAMDLRIYIENERLMWQPVTFGPTRLLYGGNHVFRPAAAINMRMEFIIENGRAVRLSMQQNSESWVAIRSR